MTTRAIIWCAVSTEEQAKKDSIIQQRADAEAYCQQQGWQIVDILSVNGHSREYTEFVEAETEMEAYQSLRAHIIARDFDVLLCRALDRLGRKPALIHQVAELCQRAGARIHCLTMPLTGDPRSDAMLIAWGGAMAGNELLEFRRRNRDGMDGRAYAGKPVCSTLPFPYYRAIDPDTGKPSGPALLDPRGKAALHEVLAMLQRGESVRACARYLNALGFTSQRGNPWNNGNLVLVLRNPFLAGTVRRHVYRKVQNEKTGKPHSVIRPQGDWIVSRGQHEPVFTPEEFEELQRLIAHKPHGRPAASGLGIYAGLLRCGYCNNRMYVHQRVERGRWNYISVSYICGGYQMGRCTHQNYIGQKRVTKLLLPVLERWLAATAAYHNPEPEIPEIPDYSAELADLDRREKAAYYAYESGRIDLKFYDERRRELQAMRETLESRIAAAHEAQEQARRSQENRRALADLLPNLPRLVKEVPPAELNAVFRALLPQFIVKDKQIVDVCEK